MNNITDFQNIYNVELLDYDTYFDETIDEYFNMYDSISLADLAVRKELKKKGNVDFLLTMRANLYTDIFSIDKIFDESYFSN